MKIAFLTIFGIVAGEQIFCEILAALYVLDNRISVKTWWNGSESFFSSVFLIGVFATILLVKQHRSKIRFAGYFSYYFLKELVNLSTTR